MPILTEKDIPAELWLKKMLHLPSCLTSSYWNLLERYKITGDALTPDDSGSHIFGGRSRKDTLQHFARRYGVSACRLESLVIDPDKAFRTIPDDLITSFTEGSISILDIACGSGAVGASLLSTISVLRTHNKLLKQPLDVRIIGGDCSDYALDIYKQMLEELEPKLNTVGINVKLTTTKWEAEKSYTTSDMFDLLFDDSPSTEEYLIVIANFAGTLSSHFPSFTNSLQHIFDRTSNKKCTIIWVESKMTSAHTLFQKLESFLKKCTPWSSSSQEEPFSYEYDWFHPFLKSKMKCRVLVKEYKRS